MYMQTYRQPQKINQHMHAIHHKPTSQQASSLISISVYFSKIIALIANHACIEIPSKSLCKYYGKVWYGGMFVGGWPSLSQSICFWYIVRCETSSPSLPYKRIAKDRKNQNTVRVEVWVCVCMYEKKEMYFRSNPIPNEKRNQRIASKSQNLSFFLPKSLSIGLWAGST